MWELRSIIHQLELRPVKPPPVEPPEFEPVADDAPLAEKEVRAAFGAASETTLSQFRRIAAVLDACGQPMDISDVQARITEWGSPSIGDKPPDFQRWTTSCVIVLEDGLVQIDLQSPHLFAMRRAVRKLAERPLRQAIIDEQLRRREQEYDVENAKREARERAIASQMRRAVLRVAPHKGPAAAAAILDMGRRVIRSFVGPELKDLPAALQEFDLIAAIGVRQSLYSLGVRDHDHWRLIDLGPPQKTRQLNRAGRKLKITPELLISGCTGISRPLGDAAKIAEYLAGDQQTKLRRRLESDVKSLLALYNYGRLNNVLRLRWGFLDELLGVGWAEPGDPMLYEMVKEYANSGAEVEIVSGTAPGWSEPWSRAVRGRVVAFNYETCTIRGDDTWTIYRYEVQAIRPAPGT